MATASTYFGQKFQNLKAKTNKIQVIFKCLPKLGHSSQDGSAIPARQDSQNQGSVEHEDTVDDMLAVS